MKSLADYRRSLGLTQAQFAALLADAGCPCTQGLVSHWERGAVAITPLRARQIEAATGGALRKETLVFFDGPDWTDRADDLLQRFASGRTTPWSGEAFLTWARMQGLGDPPSDCALERLLRDAIRRGELVAMRVKRPGTRKPAATLYAMPALVEGV
jgi:transcriptional regulator with XRE-family HTH domain